MKRNIIWIGFLVCSTAWAQKPKLVVGIVVDQMRQEYLYRFDAKFGTNGFKRLTGDGFMLTNAHYNYVPTETGPGHASIYTGATPATHGIVANEWYDRALKKDVNCVNDPNQKPVGSETNGTTSPWRMISSTITDELKVATQFRSKVIGISWKDRGAILPAGHNPDGAYWYDDKTGNFITSTYYTNALPAWVTKFNQQKNSDRYLSMEWKPLLPIEQYTEAGPDDSPYEQRYKGKDRSTFPYKLSELRSLNNEYELLGNTPFGNSIIADFAKEAIEGEQLGKDDITDFLAVSFSSTDKVGHRIGPNAVEIEDMYLRLDALLADLLATLDQKVGKGNYTVFLTADHGVSEVTQYLKDKKIPAGTFSVANTQAALEEFLQTYFPGKKIIERMSTEQIYLNADAFAGEVRTSGVDMLIATELISKFMLSREGVADVFPQSIIRQTAFDEQSIKGKVVRGFHAKRCGDIAFVLEPNWMVWSSAQGSTHGSAYSYDTHVPMVFYGNGVRKGSSAQFHAITDIAPTLSVLLKIKFPNGCTGQPITEIVD